MSHVLLIEIENVVSAMICSFVAPRTIAQTNMAYKAILYKNNIVYLWPMYIYTHTHIHTGNLNALAASPDRRGHFSSPISISRT